MGRNCIPVSYTHLDVYKRQIHNDVGNIIAKKVEATETGKDMLEKFKKKVMGSHIQVSFWKDTGTLISGIKTAIQEIIQNTPSTGWIKASEINANLFDEKFKAKAEIIKKMCIRDRQVRALRIPSFLSIYIKKKTGGYALEHNMGITPLRVCIKLGCIDSGWVFIGHMRRVDRNDVSNIGILHLVIAIALPA